MTSITTKDFTRNTLRIEAYDIATFASKIQEAVLEGYKLNLIDNDKYPVQVGIGIYCTLEKKSNEKEKLSISTYEKEGNDSFQPMKDSNPIVTKGRPKK